MTKKEKVLGLFEFLMELLNETNNANVVTNNDSESKPTPNGLDVNHSLELMKRISEIDKANADQRAIYKGIDFATAPILMQLEALKAEANLAAKAEKEREEYKNGAVNTGVTLVDGKPTLISFPRELRDKIKLDDSDVFTAVRTPLPEKIGKKPVHKKALSKKPITAKNRRSNKR